MTDTPEGGLLLCGSADSPSVLIVTLFTDVRNEQPVCLGGSDGLVESNKYEDVFLSLKIRFVKDNDFV